MMIQTACCRVIRPELTNPTTMTVVADDDWMTAVIAAPTSTPFDPVGRQFLKDRFHLVAGCRLQAVAHHLHAVEEEREAAEQ